MDIPLRVLMLEDRPADAELTLHELRRAGYALEWQRVETKADYLASLEPALDLILADYALPQFDALQALALLRARGLDTPFIIVSGMIGEEIAVAAIQQGADDYLLKDRLARLGTAVQRALQQRQLRSEKQRAEAALLENARLNQAVLRSLTAEIAVLDPTGTIIAVNDAWTQFTHQHGGSTLNTTGIGANYLDICYHAVETFNDQEAALVLAGLQAILAGHQSQFTLEYGCQTPSGQLWFIMYVTPLADHGGAVVVHEDITERKRAEEALRAAETKYRTLVEHIPAIIYMAGIDQTSSTLYVNPQVETMLGFSQAEWIADPQRWLKQLHPRDIDQVLADVAQAHNQDRSVGSELRILTRDGRVMWFRDEAVVVRDDAGQPLFMQGIMLDITERKQAEFALAERVRLAALTADVGVALTRSATLGSILQSCAAALVTHLDAAFARIWTLDEREQMLELQASAGMYTRLDGTHSRIPVGSLKIGQIAQERRPHLTNAVIGDPRVSDQEWAKREGMIAFVGYPLIVEDRLVGVMALFARNPLVPSTLDALAPVADAIALGIEHKRSEEALRHNYNLLQTVIEGTPDAIYVKDLQGRYLMINSAGARLIGKPVEAILGKDDAMLFAFDTFQILERDRRLIANGEVLTYEETDPVEDGARTYLSTKAPYRDYHGAIIGLIGISRDVTEHKRLQEQYLRAQKMESVGRLAGGVAHDFNNLLTAITGYGELVLFALSDDTPVRSDVEEILNAAKRAADLTRQLLAFARKQIVEPHVLNLNDLIVNIDKLLRRLIGEDIELITRPDPHLGQIRADPGQIEQVLLNLVVNARDAMPGGGQVLIATAQTTLDAEYARQHEGIVAGDYVVLSVSDTGLGMTEAIRAQIFEPFFTTKEPGRGTGLGLATCYGIITQSGGTISVESEVGRGTTFQLYLPCVEEAISAPAPPDNHAPTDRLTGSELILLVEDDPRVRAITSRALRAQGYTVIEATNGHDALGIVEAQDQIAIDLLLTDVVLPKIDGKTLADVITRVRPGIKVLFISGYTDNVLLQRGWSTPAFDLLQKPFSPLVLARKVRSVLDASEKRES